MNWRSLLFAPASRPERFEKALAAGADTVCLDLEDAVAPDGKVAARAAAAAFAQGRAGVGVRMNGADTEWASGDIAALKSVAPAFVMVPKATDAAALERIWAALGEVSLVPIVETAEGLKNAWDIAASPAVAAILFGGVDYSADIGAELAWEPMLYARGALAAAAGRARKPLLDVPYLDVEDDAGLIEATRRVRAMGFTGRACIHPRQIAGVHAAFTPSAAEMAHARRVVAAFDAAEGGAALLDGKLVELPVALHARRILAAAGEG
ncbi:MAG: CoA ester lyase [Alphaproteobacteria bacterium]|nr:CoA ester lyase [Alphaproteobacteria bacterium]